MLLCIIFRNETIPFILDNASEEDCLRAINKARELSFEFEEHSAIIESDRIVLHAYENRNPQKAYPKKRLYCYNDRIIWQTDTKCADEVEPTRELLAYERNISSDKICVVEI